MAVVGEHLVGHPLDVLDVGHVAAVDVGDAAGRARSRALVSSSLSTERATSSTVAPASATLTAVALPIPEEAPVIEDDLAPHRAATASGP